MIKKIFCLFLTVSVISGEMSLSQVNAGGENGLNIIESPAIEMDNMNRIIVETSYLMDNYGAVKIQKTTGCYILEYKNNIQMESAYSQLIEEYGEENVFVDSVLDMQEQFQDEIQLYGMLDEFLAQYLYINNEILLPGQVHGIANLVNQVESYTGEKNTVRVAILDTGLNSSLPIYTGRVNTELSKNFLLDTDNPTEDDYSDKNGHGSRVADVVRSCTASNVEIVAYRVFNANGQTTAAAVKMALQQALLDDIDVVNMSSGSTSISEIWDEEIAALYNAGVVVVAGAGDNSDNSADLVYPSNLSTTVSVGGIVVCDLNQDGIKDRAYYSPKGECVDFTAYGGFFELYDHNGTLQKDIGTSFSAPCVAAQFASIITFDNTKTVPEYKEILKQFVSPVFDKLYEEDPGYHSTDYGFGYMDYTDVSLCGGCGKHYCRVLYHDEPSIEDGIEFNGFQISTKLGGIRNIYSVESEIDGKKVVENGLIYGFAQNVNPEDVVIENLGEDVVNFASTEEGCMSSIISDSVGAKSYTMTMIQNIGNITPEGIKAVYYVRTYARLGDDTYIYGDVISYSLFDVAEQLYLSGQMSNESGHRYLYDNILSIAESDYEEISYTQESSLAVIN